VATVTWTHPALDLFDEICRYVARRSPEQAVRLAEQMFRATDRLALFPRIGRVVPEHKLENVREIFVQSYRVIYRVTDDEVEVLAVQHGARRLGDIPGLLGLSAEHGDPARPSMGDASLIGA
jgi:plasmid stabilization system protein ParE